MGMPDILLILFLIFSINFNSIYSAMKKEQVAELFISEGVKNTMLNQIHEAWKVIKHADDSGDIHKASFEKDVLWNDIIMQRFRPSHDELLKIDKNVDAHRPSRFLNEIVDLLELDKLVEATNNVTTAKKLNLIEYWKEGWVKISTFLIQLHFKYDWIFTHIYQEGYPENVDHELMDDIMTLLDLDRKDLPYKNRNHYVWHQINKADRGENYEKYTQTLDEVAGFTNITIAGKKHEYNMFVGLRHLLKLRPDLTGVYRELMNYNDSVQCLGEQEYAGVLGLDYEIPIYVLLYILNAEMKYYLLQNFAEMEKCVRLKNCQWKRVAGLEKHLKTYYEYYVTEMVKAFALSEDPVINAPPQAWRWGCDPPSKDPAGPRNFIEGESFARFYDFDTRFFVEERTLSMTQTCRDSCDMFDGAYSTIPCEEDEWSCLETDDGFDCWEAARAKRQCPGPARKICPNDGLLCTTTKIGKAQVCPGHTDKRYIEWVTSDGKAYSELGETKPTCPGEIQSFLGDQIHERSGITRYETQNCEVCLCRCYEPMQNETHRYMSLQPQMTDIDNNKVIIGIRFVKIDNVIHFSIAEAPLSAMTAVDSTETKWINPEPVDKENSKQTFRLARDSRTILLDDLVTPKGYAITGIRFKPIVLPLDRYFQKELGLQIHVTRVGIGGILIKEDSGWIFNQNDTRQRVELSLDNLDRPTHAPGPSFPIYVTNRFIKVQSASLKTDVGQTPIPFFDTQKVSFEGTEVLVRGVGIYLKNRPGYGGFLSFRLIGQALRDLPPGDDRYDLWYFTRDKDPALYAPTATSGDKGAKTKAPAESKASGENAPVPQSQEAAPAAQSQEAAPAPQSQEAAPAENEPAPQPQEAAPAENAPASQEAAPAESPPAPDAAPSE